MTDTTPETDGSEELPANPDMHPDVEPHPADRVRGAADSMAAVNELLWQIAKMVGIMTMILMAIFALFLAFQVAQWGATL